MGPRRCGTASILGDNPPLPHTEPEEESPLARLVREEGDRAAADTLITSHLRLVGKVAMRYRGYGLPMAVVIEEGNVGLMQAVRRFDTGRDCRLATYALWWIRRRSKNTC